MPLIQITTGYYNNQSKDYIYFKTYKLIQDMGTTCCGNKTNNVDKDLSRKASGKKNKGKNGKLDGDFNGDLPIWTVIKFQAIVRGYLTRKSIKTVYGFQRTPGMLNRGKIRIEMNPEQLEAQKKRVRDIRENLPEFQYGKYQDEDHEPGIKKEKRDLVTFPDGSVFDGEWNKSSNQRHGRGH